MIAVVLKTIMNITLFLAIGSSFAALKLLKIARSYYENVYKILFSII
jgi:hypothetical protein